MVEMATSEIPDPQPLLQGLWDEKGFNDAIINCAEALTYAKEIDVRLKDAEANLELYVQKGARENQPQVLALLAEFQFKRGKLPDAAGLLLEADLLAKGKIAYRTRFLELLLAQGHRETARNFALKWLRARSHTGLYWWFYASLVDNISQYNTLLEITPKRAKSENAARRLTRMKARAIARASRRVGLDDTAFEIYSGLLSKELEEVSLSNKASLIKRRDMDKAGLGFLQVAPLPTGEKTAIVGPVDLLQSTYEQMQQSNWQAVLAGLSNHHDVKIGPDSLIEKIKALANEQKLQAYPSLSRPNDAVIKATEILARKLNHFWLDSGSLLGIMRDNRPISWDNDIDFGIWDDEIPAMLDLNEELADKGYWVNHRSYYGRIYGGTIKIPGIRTIHIHVFYRTKDGNACSPQTLCYYKPAKRPGEAAPFANHPIARVILSKIHNAAISYQHPNPVIRVLKKRIIRRFWGLFVRIRSRVPREKWATVYPFKALYANGTWIIPAHYFDKILQIKVDGVSIPVPDETEKYLEFRYPNWRIAKQDWCYWLDDGGKTPKPPEDIGLSYVFKDAK